MNQDERMKSFLMTKILVGPSIAAVARDPMLCRS